MLYAHFLQKQPLGGDIDGVISSKLSYLLIHYRRIFIIFVGYAN